MYIFCEIITPFLSCVSDCVICVFISLNYVKAHINVVAKPNRAVKIELYAASQQAQIYKCDGKTTYLDELDIFVFYVPTSESFS